MQLSSTLTLYLKFMFTIFWTVFFGSFAIAFWVLDSGKEIGVSNSLKWGFSAFVLVGILILYRSLFRLKRVDVVDDGLVITNYFKTYHFPYPLVQSMKVLPLFLSYKIVILRFVKPTSFGKSIFFLTNTQRLESFEKLNQNITFSWKSRKSK